MRKVTSVKALPGFRLEVVFDDGTRGTISLERRFFGPVFEPLRDVALFERVFIDEYGVINWPNGADLAPDALYAQIKAGVQAA